MEEYVPAKKSLGQNFLNSKKALQDIISAAQLTPQDVVLEVGPGKGVLTELLLLNSKKVVAVEKDDRLIPFLEEKFAKEIASGNFVLVHDDVLNFDPKKSGLEAGKYKLVANIPYYITGIFLKKFLEVSVQPSDMVIMVQKEVAKRIVASDEKESILSISVKAYGMPKIISIVKAGSFVPAPNVDSAVLAIYAISKDFFGGIKDEDFFELLKTGFAGKRKTLKNNLKNFLEKKNIIPKDPETFFIDLFQKVGIEKNIRAEDLSLEQWKKIYQALTQKS